MENARPSCRIMVVDDEAGTRSFVSRVLRSAGYEVLEAKDGAEAADLYDASGRPIDLLLSDVVMPRFNGRALAQLLSERQPGLKVVFMSGYAHSGRSDGQSWTREVAFLQKPFSPQELILKVRSCLQEPAAAAQPVAAAAAPSAGAWVFPAPQAKTSGKLLIIDDDPGMRRILERCADVWGCEAESVGDGLSAFRRLREAEPALVLLDLQMPWMGGIEFLKVARALRPELAVIVVTASENEDLAKAALDLGAADYILKPFDIRRLRAAVNTVLAQKRASLSRTQPR